MVPLLDVHPPSCLTCLQCPSETYDALHKSTKDFPDEVVSFMRQHQLMWEPVLPLGGRPILTRVNVDHILKKVVVDRVEAEDGPYDVLHLGTGEGVGGALTEPYFYNRKLKHLSTPSRSNQTIIRTSCGESSSA